ncbi:type III-A CRISPR-associated protein Csm2 [Pasteurella multocida]|uniref:type III-A CRISPR-associated protein Csm2 n=1 Tax=Pasteurella multocida TaxID=747 RepID=UPI0007ED7164|nr:type III-A CRISPR-associated protein Csm2 [Pasteurella multocida]MCL7789011.1 type III-A CRISPR-associated protein Csm2 [Pasteurella multocida]OBP31040.1 type III-A CRISPR-associated protein Csm2 [Pasteurella multocida subsp. multocida]PNM07760.1 type III-A CRISPR-associated protein Csm2 [Pasteurella multocida]WRK03802.1 type III-A CRISPR-associated protein Csm2 [Pasteurella multocida]WVM63838.1 type III-A CRISPR-associated protein Csm2 [Pasteurella multocida]
MEHLIKFGRNKDATIFSDIAEQAAKKIKSNKNANNTTQLRKFYGELAMWNDRVQLYKTDRNAKFNELLPFIKMMKAKVAYARSRKHIDDQFLRIFSRCIDEITSVDTLKDAKLFMEAVMGYCKLEEI